MAEQSLPKKVFATLLTDFGTQDPYLASMKGVILCGAPQARIIDLANDLPAHDVLAAAFILAQAAPFYPPGTLHIVVVDPGVGTDRRILAAQFAEHTYLFPDNGVISFIAQALPMAAMAVVRNTKFLPPINPSLTFQGRDIFAPVASHILNGADIHDLGPQPDSFKTLDIPTASATNGTILGQVLYVDRFGNLISNIPQTLLTERNKDKSCLRVFCAGRDVGPLQGTYGLVERGKTLALFNSMGLLEVAVNQGRACDVLNASIGAEIIVKC